MTMWRSVSAVFRRDLRLAWAGGGAAAPLGFFAGATTLVPLAVGPDLKTLALIGPSLLWVTVALAALMILERLFQADLEDGSLDQLHLVDAPLEFIVAAKGAALWTAIGLPLALASLPAALALQTPPPAPRSCQLVTRLVTEAASKRPVENGEVRSVNPTIRPAVSASSSSMVRT